MDGNTCEANTNDRRFGFNALYKNGDLKSNSYHYELQLIETILSYISILKCDNDELCERSSRKRRRQ